MIIIDHTREFLQCLDCSRDWKIFYGCDFGRQRADAFGRDMMSQKIDFFDSKNTFIMTKDEASCLQTVEDDA